MTVKELKMALDNYPDDMGVKVTIGRRIEVLKEVKDGVNMENNHTYVWLVGDDYYDFKFKDYE